MYILKGEKMEMNEYQIQVSTPKRIMEIYFLFSYNPWWL